MNFRYFLKFIFTSIFEIKIHEKKKFLETKKKSFSRAINFVYLAQNFTDFFELRIPPF